jgi:hypothetical protein
MVRRTALALAAGAASLTLVAACGSSSSGGTAAPTSSAGQGANDSSAPPKAELIEAFHSLHQGSVLTTTLSLGTTSANLIHISGEGGDTPLTQHQADLISSARLTIETAATAGKTLADTATDPGAVTFSLTGSAGGTTYFTILGVDKVLYFQLDLKDLLRDVGQPQLYNSILRRASFVPNLPAFATGFLNGKYVSLPLATVTGFEQFLEGFYEGASQGALPGMKEFRAIGRQIIDTVVGDLQITRPTTGVTDRLEITGNVRNIAKDVLATLKQSLPASLSSQIDAATADSAPNQDLTLEAAVTGGAVSTLTFDVGQFSPHHKDTLPVVVGFAKSGPPISAPSGSTPINLRDLTAFFSAIGEASS